MNDLSSSGRTDAYRIILTLHLTYQVFCFFYYMNIYNQTKYVVMATKYWQSESCEQQLFIEYSGNPVGESVHFDSHRSY